MQSILPLELNGYSLDCWGANDLGPLAYQTIDLKILKNTGSIIEQKTVAGTHYEK